MTNMIEGTSIGEIAVKLEELGSRFGNNPLVELTVYGISGERLTRQESQIALDSGKARGLEVLAEMVEQLKKGDLAGVEVTAMGSGRFMIQQPDGLTVFYEQDSSDCMGGDCPDDAKERIVVETPFLGDPSKTIDFEASLPALRK